MGGEKQYLRLVLVAERNKEKKREEEGKKEKGNERKKDLVASSSSLRRSNGRSSSGRDLKSVYTTRATLQDVEILPTLVYSTIRGCLSGFLYDCPILTLHTVQILGLVFSWETEGFFTRVLHRSCSSIYELHVRLLNHPNRTSTVQVMVNFTRLPQLMLFVCLCPDLGIGFQLGNRGNLDLGSS